MQTTMTTPESKTPLTDSEYAWVDSNPKHPDYLIFCNARDFARSLELQLAEANAQLAKAQNDYAERLESVVKQYGSEMKVLKDTLAEAVKDKDLLDWLFTDDGMIWFSYQTYGTVTREAIDNAMKEGK